MNRRKNIKSLLVGGISIPLLTRCGSTIAGTEVIPEKNERSTPTIKISPWHYLPDMNWTGPDYWGNRLQDWHIKNKQLECLFSGPNRTLHCLTHQIGSSRNSFKTSVNLVFPNDVVTSPGNRVGLLLGAKSDFKDYRASAIKGQGLKAGVNTEGRLFIGDSIQEGGKRIGLDILQEGILLQVVAEPWGMNYKLTVTAYNEDKGGEIARYEKHNIVPETLEGNIALVSDWNDVPKSKSDAVSCIIKKWTIEGNKLREDVSQKFGPICFAQYTKQQNVVKLTAQMMPVALPGEAFLEIKDGDTWERIADAEIVYPSYTAHFIIPDWKYATSVSYRIGYEFLQEKGSLANHYWEGSIAEEPLNKDSLKVLACSCNFDYGFPDQEIVDYAGAHDPDVIMFLGDQFYEPNGGFGIQKAPLEKSIFDYLRKWYQFGWSYRELFRHRPTINLPDDHDVFQGNLFGAGGKAFPKTSSEGFSRDYGGFMMPAEWVNLVMTTQTSHMPEPFDPTPADQHIKVFYTDWKYAGISFGIIEDRKFKSGPAAILPVEAKVRDAFVTNSNYDISKHTFTNAELIGKRQMTFLNSWIEDWDHQTEFKVLVSATPFHALQTLPKGAASNGLQRKLHVPEKGEYVMGDVPVADMDSGGWPQNKRDEILNIIRKAYVIHLTGDQHLPSVTQYGVQDFRDGGVAFAVPALANSWPRRWWPPVPQDHKPHDSGPDYTGSHLDAFGNKIYVKAVANPHQTGLDPAYLYDRSPGYGIISFDKKNREVTMECWPRHINPVEHRDKQYEGWPVIVHQKENFNPSVPFFLPVVEISGIRLPVIRIINEKDGQLVSVLSTREHTLQPVVDQQGMYRLEIYGSQGKLVTSANGLKGLPREQQKEKVEINISE